MSGDSGQFDSGASNVNELKDYVLQSHTEFLLEELGDPGRYLPHLRSKGVLSLTDCQTIRSKETFQAKIESLVKCLRGKLTSKNEHSFDILVDALKKQRVQAHIARGLQKALVKEKERTVIHVKSNEVNETRLQLKPMLQQLPCREEESYTSDFHPEHGQLPVPPSGASVSSKVSMCSYDSNEDGGDHPVFGKLPASCHSSDDGPTFSMPRRNSSWTSNSEVLESSSDSEPGGQGQFISLPSSQASFIQSHSRSGCLLDSDSSLSSSHHDSVEVVKLNERIKDLTDQLQDAYLKLDAKNAKIEELEMKLREFPPTSSKLKEEPVFSKVSSRTEVAYPSPNKQAQSSSHFLVQKKVMIPRNNTAPSISATTGGVFHDRGSDAVVYNIYKNYSNSPASVSTV